MLYGLDQHIIDSIIECLKTNPKIDESILYGSRAKGNFKTGSDIDIALKGKKLTLQDIFHLSQQLDELMTPYKFDLVIYHKIENPDLVDHINRVGKRIYIKEKII